MVSALVLERHEQQLLVWLILNVTQVQGWGVCTGVPIWREEADGFQVWGHAFNSEDGMQARAARPDRARAARGGHGAMWLLSVPCLLPLQVA